MKSKELSKVEVTAKMIAQSKKGFWKILDKAANWKPWKNKPRQRKKNIRTIRADQGSDEQNRSPVKAQNTSPISNAIANNPENSNPPITKKKRIHSRSRPVI